MSPFPPPVVERLKQVLASKAGGYLRNPVREPRVTCAVCATPVAGYSHCYRCNDHRQTSGTADLVAPLTYAIAGRQSGYVMRGYKAQPPVAEHRAIMAMLMIVGIADHADCAARILDAELSHWAVVPSLPAKAGPHPLRELVAGAAGGAEVTLTAHKSPKDPRALSASHFRTDDVLPPGSHVLLMDDTWTGGGHVQSAALALRAAGAECVSVLVAARWLREEYGDNSEFIRDRCSGDYDPGRCPWTGSDCP